MNESLIPINLKNDLDNRKHTGIRNGILNRTPFLMNLYRIEVIY